MTLTHTHQLLLGYESCDEGQLLESANSETCHLLLQYSTAALAIKTVAMVAGLKVDEATLGEVHS